MAPGPTITSITTALLSHVDANVRADLFSEDPKTAVERYFGPFGFLPITGNEIFTGTCSIDGYYDCSIDEKRPWIIYRNDVHEARIRFTILHELGHHLLTHVAASLLDDLDTLAGSYKGDVIQAEEAVCNSFAADILIPRKLIQEVVGTSRIVPGHVKMIHEKCLASWEAVAVRVAEFMSGTGAVVLLRDKQQVSFCAASPQLGRFWWPRGSALNPSGPLARGLTQRTIASQEIYRYDLAYARAMFCDTLPIERSFAVAVLSDKPSDGSLSLIEPTEPLWRTKTEFCEWHLGVERDVGWCEKCKGRRCPECGRCGCTHLVKNPLCPKCGYLKAFRKGAKMCYDCEADFR